MKWTTDKPTKPGFYPFKSRPHEKLDVVQVVKYADGELMVWRFGMSVDVPLTRISPKSLWAGPIEAPK